MKQKGGKMGFYPINTEVLKFDVNKDVEEIRFNHYIVQKENYQRLKNTLIKGQFYLAINSVKDDLNISYAKAQRLIQKFVKLGIIINVFKPGQGSTELSIYKYNSCLKSDNDNDSENDNESDNDKASNYKGLKSDSDNDNENDNESDNSKKEDIKKNYKKENIYSHWNNKEIIVHKSLTKDMEKAIEKVLKKYSENEIVQAIDSYSEILESDFYFNYKWSLADFLNRKNGLTTFMEEGTNKVNYDEHLAKQLKEKKNGTEKPKEIHLRGWD